MTKELTFSERHGIAPKELLKARDERKRCLDRYLQCLADWQREIDATKHNIEILAKEIAEIDASLKTLADA